MTITYKTTIIRYLLLITPIFFMVACTAPKHSYKSSPRYKKARSHASTKRNYSKNSRTSRNISRKSIAKKSAHLDSKRASIINTAKKYYGIPYIYGGKSPSGFDCSGFTTYIYQKQGVDIKGSSAMLAQQGKKIEIRRVKPGDLIFFGKARKVSHVGIVSRVGPEVLELIHSTSSRGVVRENIYHSKYWKERMLFARDILSCRS